MTDTTQAVADPVDALAKPSVDTGSARTEPPVDPLDAALSEYDQAAAKPVAPASPPEPPQVQLPPDAAAEFQSVRRVAGEWQRRMDRQDIGALIKEVRGDLDSEVLDDDVVEGWVNALAVKDPRLNQAWLQREQNPKAYAKVVKELGVQFHKKFSKLPDREVTEDRMAVHAAVRGASNPNPPREPAKDMTRLSNSEFRKNVIEQFGYDPGV